MTAAPLDRLGLPVTPIEPRPGFTAELLRRIQRAAPAARDTATVRYFADDLDAAVSFYRQLGFDLELSPSPAFVMLYRGDLRLLLSTPQSHRVPDGTVPTPGGWNRISLLVENLDDTVETLRHRGVRFRSAPTSSVAIRHAVIEDPAGNPIELFEPLAGYH